MGNIRPVIEEFQPVVNQYVKELHRWYVYPGSSSDTKFMESFESCMGWDHSNDMTVIFDVSNRRTTLVKIIRRHLENGVLPWNVLGEIAMGVDTYCRQRRQVPIRQLLGLVT